MSLQTFVEEKGDNIRIQAIAITSLIRHKKVKSFKYKFNFFQFATENV